MNYVSGNDVTPRDESAAKNNGHLIPPYSPKIGDMGLNYFTLSFAGQMEEIFLKDYFKKSLNQIRFYMTIGILFFGIFSILDAVIVPDIKERLWVIRYFFICPPLLLLVLISYSRFFERYMQACLTGVMIWTGVGIIGMTIIAHKPIGYYYYAGLILILMYGYTFIRIRFLWAALGGWVIVAFYEAVSMWVIAMPFKIFINNSFFLITANIVGMFACYSIELYIRRDFYLAKLLEMEKEKVKSANTRLEKSVQERTSQLMTTNEDLKQEILERKRMEKELIQAHKMEAIGTLAGGIAHDFNNILTAIIGYAEIGLYKKNITEDKIRNCFEQVHNGGERARDLVGQILTFSRQQEQKRGPINVGTIVKEALKLMQATLPKNIDIRSFIKTRKDIVLADPTQIHQILMNLCTNAAHAMKEKGGELEVQLDNGAYDQRRTDDTGAALSLHLSVKDTGTGMAPDIMERIFDPYFTTKVPGEGTGMGLSVVHGIVKNHGGALHVESDIGKGSTFHIYLPVMQRDNQEGGRPAHDAPMGSERILFVDDEEPIKELAETMLDLLGYTVVACTSSRAALELFREQPEGFDLVITDQTMPDLTGLELTKELIRIRSDIPIILCTGFSELITEKTVKDLGINELFMKPIVMHEMADCIKRVITRSKEGPCLRRVI